MNCAGVTTTALLEEIPHSKVEVSGLWTVVRCSIVWLCLYVCAGVLV